MQVQIALTGDVRVGDVPVGGPSRVVLAALVLERPAGVPRERLADVLWPGAFCLFHDFNDFRNADPAYEDYGVYQGVADGLQQGRFEFWGIYGCCGLYRALPAPRSTSPP